LHNNQISVCLANLIKSGDYSKPFITSFNIQVFLKPAGE